MAGYSGTPLAVKLGIIEGSTLAILTAPDDFGLDLPFHLAVKRQARGQADVVLAFFTTRADLGGRIDQLGEMIFPSGGLWIAWPKKSSGVKTDLSDHVARDVVLPRGLVDNKVCAVDETWTGLRFVWRTENRTRPG